MVSETFIIVYYTLLVLSLSIISLSLKIWAWLHLEPPLLKLSLLPPFAYCSVFGPYCKNFVHPCSILATFLVDILSHSLWKLI